MANKALAIWEGHTTEQVAIQRGLRHGCLLSPLLFVIYLRGLEKALEQSGLEFHLSFLESGRPIVQSLPGFIYVC